MDELKPRKKRGEAVSADKKPELKIVEQQAQSAEPEGAQMGEGPNEHDKAMGREFQRRVEILKRDPNADIPR